MNVPAALQSPVNDASWETKVSFPLPSRPGLTVKRDKVIASCIVRLLSWCSPSAVTWFVISVYVDSVNRVFSRRLAPHVRDEIFERSPFLTVGDSSRPISCVTDVSRIVAPLAHLTPCSVFRRVRFFVYGPFRFFMLVVCRANLSALLSCEAATRLYFSAKKVFTEDFFFDTARTTAKKPRSSAFGVLYPVQNSVPSECLAC